LVVAAVAGAIERNHPGVIAGTHKLNHTLGFTTASAHLKEVQKSKYMIPEDPDGDLEPLEKIETAKVCRAAHPGFCQATHGQYWGATCDCKSK